MDYPNDDNELCEWEGADFYLPKDSNPGISNCIWDGVDQNEDEFSYMFEDSTPIKACEDLPYSASDSGRSTEKEAVNYREDYHPQLKRRRMLRFDAPDDPFLCNEPTPSQFIKAKDRQETTLEAVHEKVTWDSGYSEDRSVSCNERLDQSSDMWLSNCFNDGSMHFGSEDTNFSGVGGDQIDVSEYCNLPPETQSDMGQQCPTPPPQKVFKGRKSLMLTPTKVTSSVIYPFALIKPCGVHGDVTLKDINKKILTPPQKSKHGKDEELSPPYPTSAFSGKPVVVKTKIHTEGGKGSITIMRTKG